MTFSLSATSLRRLAVVHPDLIRVAVLGIQRSPIDFAVSEGAREIERQRELLAKGWSKTLSSKHLIQPDGFAHAFDIVAVGDLDRDGDVDAQDKALTWDRGLYTEISAAMLGAAATLGVRVRWGGSFKSFFDGPHYELART